MHFTHEEPSSGSSTGTSGSDASATGRLSPQLAEFLVGEASRADDVATQLAACQAVVKADRNIGG